MLLLDVSATCSSAALASVLSAFKRIMLLIQIMVPIILIIWGTSGIISLVIKPDEKNGIKKVVNKFIAAIVVFMVPVLMNFTMGLLGENTNFSSCWNEASTNISREVTYQSVSSDDDRTSFIPNPSDYEKGKPKPSTGSNGGGQSFSGGTLVKHEETSTLKVSIYKSNSYYVTQIWAQNPYQQLNKYDSPNYGSGLHKPGNLLARAAGENGLSNKLIIGFNASGFYLRDTYDSSSVNAYGAYDKTSVGTLVITNGRVVRNAYKHAVKTWYIAGVDQSNRLRIFEDQKSSDASAKKAWSESVIGTIRNTFTFASPLVINGQASNITTSMPSPGTAKNRQAFCQIDSNNFALITGANLSRQDLINIMLQLKCQTGTNFDGGGSIALLFKSANSREIETITGNRRSLTEVGYFTE